MAQTGYTPIYLYYSGTATHIPLAANLGNGELAINAADGNLFYKNTSNAVVTIPVLQSSSTQSGWLSSTDWNTFNSKAPAGSYLTAVTADSPLTGAGTSASHLSIPAASGSTNGYLTSTDWTTFNSKQPAGTYVTSVSGTAPVVSSGGTTPAISMAAATGSVNGYLTSTDWTTFNGKQAALVSGTNIKTVSGTTLLGSGDLGTIGVGYGGTGTSTAFTAGSVVYAGASGVYSQDNANFFWDSTNHYLGIGTTSPYCKLELYNTIYLPASGEATGVGSLRITNNQNVLSAAGGIEFKGTGNGSGSGSKIQNLNGQGLTFAVRSNSATWTNAMQIAEGSGGVSIGNTTDPGAKNLSVSGQITATGSVNIYDTGPTLQAQINASSASWIGPGLYVATSSAPSASNAGVWLRNPLLGYSMWSSGATTSTIYHLGFVNGNGLVGHIETNGTATNYVTSSDERLKTNIQNAVSSIDSIQQIKVRSFDWLGSQEHQEYGVIAQELYEIAPEAVSTGRNDEDMWGVDYSKLVPRLIKSLQELKQQFDDYVASHP